eukprot:jgi/Psemu1/17164/gm1.17164_g
MPIGHWFRDSDDIPHRGVTPDTSIDTGHEIRYLRGRLEDLTEDNYDLREYAFNQSTQLQT